MSSSDQNTSAPLTSEGLASDVKKLFLHKNFSDVTLIGSDGKSVPAVKFILAARSEVFIRMFDSNFIERSSLEVQMHFSSVVLEAVVEFCFTDKLGVRFDDADDADDADDQARTLVLVSCAAHYLDIPLLEKYVLEQLDEIMSHCPPLACAVYDEASRLGIPAENLLEASAEKIRSNLKSSLLNEASECGGGVRALDESALGKIVFDEKLTTSEVTKFSCLQKWAEETTEDSEESTKRGHEEEETTNAVSWKRRKFSIASNLAKRVDLSLIPASELSTLVEESGLVSSEALYRFYKSQALKLQALSSPR